MLYLIKVLVIRNEQSRTEVVNLAQVETITDYGDKMCIALAHGETGYWISGEQVARLRSFLDKAVIFDGTAPNA